MIQEFVDKFLAGRDALAAKFAASPPSEYKDVVRAVIETISQGDYGQPDAARIHEINDGSYQGVLVYVIGASGYQPSDYWYVRVYYGSCSGCDTLEAIRGYSSEPPTAAQVQDYLTLALHIVQQLKKMSDEGV